MSYLVVVWDQGTYVPVVFEMRPPRLVATIEEAVTASRECGLKMVALHKDPQYKMMILGVFQPCGEGDGLTATHNLPINQAVRQFINTLKAHEMFDSRIENFMVNWLYTKVLEGYN